MDLGTFYREFQNPPQLSSLSIDIGAQSMAEDLVWENEISVFEGHMFSQCSPPFPTSLNKSTSHKRAEAPTRGVHCQYTEHPVHLRT